MAKSPFAKREERTELTRRALIKWSVAAGAALGVSRSKIFDILEKTAGKSVAEAASASLTHRYVGIAAGNGGLAWFTSFWPQNAVAAAGNPNYAVKPGSSVMPGTAKPLTVTADTPWMSIPAANQVSVFQCGNNETHTQQPVSPLSLNGSNIWSVVSALQAGASAVIPLITIGNVDVGTAAGAARPSNVNNGDGIVGLFNSAASRAGGLLSNPADASLYKAHYDAFTQLNRAANRSTTKISYTAASGAAGFLGTNLSTALAITAADLTRYGINGNTRSNVSDIGRALIVTVKAFKMGLTNAVVLPAMDDDPHGAFDGGDINIVPGQLKGIFDGFMNDLAATIDDTSQLPLSQDTVISIHGDTNKDPMTAAGWPDGTANNSNTVFCYSAGELNSGWYGGYTIANNKGTATGFDNTGATATYNGPMAATYATSAIAYAVAKRDDRAVGAFENGLITVSAGIGKPPTGT